MPCEDLIYVADSAYTPYGERSDRQIEKRVLLISDFLEAHNVKAIVVACNTATAAAVNLLRDRYAFPIVGLEPALKPAAEASINKRVGVLATQATLRSQKYLSLKSKYFATTEIFEKASPLFVNLVEESEKISTNEFALIANELKCFQSAMVDSLVLGCTHYPFLTDAISKIMGKDVTLYESSTAVAMELHRRLINNFNAPAHPGKTCFYSTHPKSAQAKFERIIKHPIELNTLTLE
jgi:glutamate racemase